MSTLNLPKPRSSITQTLINWENRYAGLWLLLLYMAALAYFGWFVIRPAMGSNYSFAAFYTAAHILAHRPEVWSQIYDMALIYFGFGCSTNNISW